MIYLRRIAWDLYYRRKHLAITNGQVRGRNTKKIITMLMAKLSSQK
jgi:hypothetical protein